MESIILVKIMASSLKLKKSLAADVNIPFSGENFQRGKHL